MCWIHSAAGDPPWPGWLGKRTRNRSARRAWNSSQRPAPPAPCRKSRSGPPPPLSICTGVPRTLRSLDPQPPSCAGSPANDEAAVRREPLARVERRVVGREEECGGRDLFGLPPASERRAAHENLLHERRDEGRHGRLDVARTD